MDNFSRFFQRPKAEVSVKTNDELAARNSEYFSRLVTKYGQGQYQEGLPERSMPLQDLVDVVGLYLLAAGGDMRMLPSIQQTLARYVVDGLIDFNQLDTELRGDICHYPGGLIVRQKLGVGMYSFMLVNRQQMDNGKAYIEGIFKACGLPIRPNLAP